MPTTPAFTRSCFLFQSALLLVMACCFVLEGKAQHRLVIRLLDKDTAFLPAQLGLQQQFANPSACIRYVNELTGLMRSKGYAGASVDAVQYDSTSTSVDLFVGPRQARLLLDVSQVEKKALDETGYLPGNFKSGNSFQQLDIWKEKLLDFYENNGHPFAAISLDSIRLQHDSMYAQLKVNKGPVYYIDSMHVVGNVKLSNFFLQKYLGIPKHSLYSKKKWNEVSKRLLELPFVEEEQASDMTLLGSGSVLNLYLKPKRSSQVNFLVGFLPANNETGALQLTGDINLNLKNLLGKAETIILNWQQLQLQSPRLNIGYQQPYVFKSNFGIDFSFDLFKKDSSFIQLNAQLGVQYLFSGKQTGKLFIQQLSTYLQASGIDTNQIKSSKKLPINVDVSSVNVGVDYEFNNTNYRFNPRKGNVLRLTATVGIKTLSKNTNIISLTEPGFDFNSLYDSFQLKSYQLRVKLHAAHFFPVKKQGTFMLAAHAGVYNSQQIFRNELFQIGGFKLLRGFDEESIYATQYGVVTAEFRQLFSLNSYLFGFVDAGWVRNNYQQVNLSNQFISAGFGLFFDTKLGMLNISLALGKRDDVGGGLGQAAKIHFGYINYF